MIIRQTQNNMHNIQKLRTIYANAIVEIDNEQERISLIQKSLNKIIIKNILLKLITLFIFSYKKEVIKLAKDEINAGKNIIANATIAFNHTPSQSTYLIDKIIVLLGMFRKMRIFHRLDGAFYSYEKIDLQDINHHYFQIYFKKDSKVGIEDETHIYEFNSLFIGKYDKKGKLLEMFGHDNTTIEAKDILYDSRSKRSGLILEKETWLYHLDDGSRDRSFSDNYPIYTYKFRLIKITFKGKDTTHDFVFMGNDFEKMKLYESLLNDYLKCIKKTYYEIVNEKVLSPLPQEKLLELFYEKADYSWIIFKILLNADGNIQPWVIKRTYRLTVSDILEIVKILKRYSYINVSLGLELIPIYKKDAVNEMFKQYKYHYKNKIMKGHTDG